MPRKLRAGTLQTHFLALERTSVHRQEALLEKPVTPLSASHALEENNLLICCLAPSSLGFFFLLFIMDVISKGQLGASSQLIFGTALLLRGSRCEMFSLGIKLSEPI